MTVATTKKVKYKFRKQKKMLNLNYLLVIQILN